MVSKSNTAAVTRLAPEIAKLALSVLPVPETNVYVKVSPASTSVELSAPTVVPEDAFSATADTLKATAVGASLTFVTVIVNAFSKLKPSWSLVLIRMV